MVRHVARNPAPTKYLRRVLFRDGADDEKSRRLKNMRTRLLPEHPELIFRKKPPTLIFRFSSYSHRTGIQRISMQRILILLGILLLVAGLTWPWLSKLPFGKLPGDISVERENFSFYFPLTTSLLVSLVLSLLLWWWFRK